MWQEAESQSEQQLSADTYYKPHITPNSEFPEKLLHLSHSFGYDSGRRANLKLLDDRTLIFIGGNLLVLLDVNTKEQRRGNRSDHGEEELYVTQEKSVKSSWEAVEDLDLLNREKLQKMSELDVMVPLRLHQAKNRLKFCIFTENGSMPSDLSEALVLDKSELDRLHERIQQLQAEKLHQKYLHPQARQQHSRLIHDHRDMAAKIQMLEQQFKDLMMTKFGKLVDLEALQTLSGNRRLEELKQEKLLKEDAYANEIRQWDAKVEEARQALMEVIGSNQHRASVHHDEPE